MPLALTRARLACTRARLALSAARLARCYRAPPVPPAAVVSP